MYIRIAQCLYSLGNLSPFYDAGDEGRRVTYTLAIGNGMSSGVSYILLVFDRAAAFNTVQRCEKRLVNLVKHDPGRVRQNS